MSDPVALVKADLRLTKLPFFCTCFGGTKLVDATESFLAWLNADGLLSPPALYCDAAIDAFLSAPNPIQLGISPLVLDAATESLRPYCVLPDGAW